jgi:hypothetical protein
MRNIEFRTWYRNQPLGDCNEAESVRGGARVLGERRRGLRARRQGRLWVTTRRAQQRGAAAPPRAGWRAARPLIHSSAVPLHSPSKTLYQVLYTVREDFDNPWTIVARNTMHEQKLRSWKAMGPEEKVLSKMVGILDQVRVIWEI